MSNQSYPLETPDNVQPRCAPSTRQAALVTFLATARRPRDLGAIAQRLSDCYGGPVRAAEKLLDRDIESLRAWGFPIALRGNGAERGYVLLSEGQDLLSRDFSLAGDEAAALAEALGDPVLLGQLDPLTRRALARLLAFHGPLNLATDLERAEQRGLALATRLLDMANRELACRMRYCHQQGTERWRVVSPLGLELLHGQSYLAALCHESGIPKVFRLDRIRALEQAEEAWRRPEETFDLAAFFAQARSDFRKRRDAQVRVAAAEAWRLRELYPWAVDGCDPQGGLRAHFPVADEAVFFRMLLAFGPQAELLGPPVLRRAFARFMGQRP